MARQGSKDSDGPKGSVDGSALPSTASWAHALPPKPIRRPSQSTSRATPSPQMTHAALAPQKAESKPQTKSITGPSKADEIERSSSHAESSTAISGTHASRPFDPVQSVFDNVLKSVSSQQFHFSFSDSCLSEEEREEVENFPVLIDPYGGAKRRVMQDKELAERARLEADAKINLEAQARSAAEEALDDVDMGAGSLALGGEPEDNPRSTSGRGAIGRPSQAGSMADQFAAMNLRSLTPQQRQQLGLASGNVQQAPGLPQPSPEAPPLRCPTSIDGPLRSARLSMIRSVTINATALATSTAIRNRPQRPDSRDNNNPSIPVEYRDRHLGCRLLVHLQSVVVGCSLTATTSATQASELPKIRMQS